MYLSSHDPKFFISRNRQTGRLLFTRPVMEALGITGDVFLNVDIARSIEVFIPKSPDHVPGSFTSYTLGKRDGNITNVKFSGMSAFYPERYYFYGCRYTHLGTKFLFAISAEQMLERYNEQ